MADEISSKKSTGSAGAPFGKHLGKAALAPIAFPSRFLGLTLFALWPSRLGFPTFWRRVLVGSSRSPRTANLRLVLLRVLLRRTRLLTGRRLSLADVRRVAAWLLLPLVHVVPACFGQARDLWRARRKKGDDPGSLGAQLVFAMESTVDALRYANGMVSRMWFDPDRRSRADFHVPNFFHVRAGCIALNHALNPTLPLEERHHDKLELYRLGKEKGWSVAPVYASYRDGAVSEHESLDPGAALLSKPANLAQGHGVFERWWPQAEAGGVPSSYRGDDGAVASLQRIHAHLAALSRGGPYLLQRLLEPHPLLAALAGSPTLCTLRLPTCRFPDGRVQVLPLAFLRLPRESTIFDNMSQGAIAYRVDIETGRLAAGGAYNTRETFEVHPSTGRRVAGEAVPFFREARDLCARAHGEGLPRFPTVGWDVALTAEGVVLLEANISWATEHNIPGEPFLGETDYAECVLEHLRLLWPQHVPDL